MNKITLQSEYSRIWNKVLAGENFAFIRNGDSEQGLMVGKALKANEGWTAPNTVTALGKALKDSISIDAPDYYIGISCPCCDWDDHIWYLQNVKSKNITFATLWINSNYPRFMEDFGTLERDAVVIANHRAKGKPIGKLNVLDYFCVSDDCVNFWEQDSQKLITDIVEKYGNQDNLLYAVSAGPMSGPIIAALYRNNPNNCYLDFGSAIDPFYWGKQTRSYMEEGTECSLKQCWMYDPRQSPLDQRIPKIIHYCWFGRGKKSGLIKKCIKSWKKYCPDWQIIEWNEDNFDVNSTLWTKQAYEAKKWAFVSDYVRLKALKEMGGVYLDTDVQLVKPLERLLIHNGFCSFETNAIIASCVIGAQAGHPVISKWIDWYKDRAYLVDGKPNMIPNVNHITQDLVDRGILMNGQFQCVDHMAVYPRRWFCPPYEKVASRKLSKDTCAIHYFDSSWRSKQGRKSIKRSQMYSTPMYQRLIWLRYLPNRIIRKVLGDGFIDNIKKKLGR